MKDSITVANELVRVAKLLVGADTPAMKEINKLISLAEDVASLNLHTMSHDEYVAYRTDWMDAFKRTSELKSWGNFEDAVYEMKDAYESVAIDEDELDENKLHGDYEILKAVLVKHGVYERILHPQQYINREREFEQGNKAFLSVIPKWLRPVMVENEITIAEGLGGFYFNKGDDSMNSVSPEFEEIVDLIGWAKSNLNKLS